MNDIQISDNTTVPEIQDPTTVEAGDFGLSPTAESALPEGLPAKFLDPESGALRADVLARSYVELERRFSGGGIPETAEGYDLEMKLPNMSVEPGVNAKLHAAGFTQEQAQLVYDMAAEHLGPMMNQTAALFQQQRQVDRLNQHFGGSEKWGELSQQIKAWGKSNLPPDVYVALSSSYDGVLALHRMMNAGDGEPGLGRAEGGADGLSESKLRKMMEDPRYWRDQDPAYAEEIRRGFERLYPSEG